MNNLLKYFIVIASIVFCSSCSNILEKIYGIKDPEVLNHEEQVKYLNEYGFKDFTCVDVSPLFYDTTSYKTVNLFTYANDPSLLQLRFYNADSLISGWEIYVDGLKRSEFFAEYPPKELYYINKPQSPANILKWHGVDTLSSSDALIVILWADFLGLKNKEMLASLKSYLDTGMPKDIKYSLLFINQDNIFAENGW